MATPIFVNLPVSDLERSKAFYEALGWRIEPSFTDENAACVVVEEGVVHIMLLRREFFQTFTTKEVADPATTAQVLLAIGRDSREAVAETAERALAAGGRQARDPQDLGFMVQHAVEDPDGTILELMWMDPRAAEQGPEAYLAGEGDEG